MQAYLLVVVRASLLRLILLLNLILVFTIGSLNICPGAIALLRQHHEQPNVLRYHAQDSLKDRDGNTWQVLLFPDNGQDSSIQNTSGQDKNNQDKTRTSGTNYYLRLVGFPGIKSFAHPQSLEIITSQGNVLTAADVYSESSPAPNVGQYDLTALMPSLPLKGSLKLTVILQENKELSLKIPPKVVAEWQLLTNEIESKSKS